MPPRSSRARLVGCALVVIVAAPACVPPSAARQAPLAPEVTGAGLGRVRGKLDAALAAGDTSGVRRLLADTVLVNRHAMSADSAAHWLLRPGAGLGFAEPTYSDACDSVAHDVGILGGTAEFRSGYVMTWRGGVHDPVMTAIEMAPSQSIDTLRVICTSAGPRARYAQYPRAVWIAVPGIHVGSFGAEGRQMPGILAQMYLWHQLSTFRGNGPFGVAYASPVRNLFTGEVGITVLPAVVTRAPQESSRLREQHNYVHAVPTWRYGRLTLGAGPAIVVSRWDWSSSYYDSDYDYPWTSVRAGAEVLASYSIPLTSRIGLTTRWNQGWFGEDRARRYSTFPGAHVSTNFHWLSIGVEKRY